MGLAHFEPETKEIKFKAKGTEYSFTVRGLNATDLSVLISEHLVDIEAAWILAAEGYKEVIRQGRMDGFILKMVSDAPGLVAEIISVAADERPLVEKYAKLPFSISVQALAEVCRLTMVEAGGLKNLLAALSELIQSGLLEQAKDTLLNSQSDDSTGVSEKT